ncbi:hypothetical protein D3C71_1658510 [compost metagenome]
MLKVSPAGNGPNAHPSQFTLSQRSSPRLWRSLTKASANALPAAYAPNPRPPSTADNEDMTMQKSTL